MGNWLSTLREMGHGRAFMLTSIRAHMNVSYHCRIVSLSVVCIIPHLGSSLEAEHAPQPPSHFQGLLPSASTPTYINHRQTNLSPEARPIALPCEHGVDHVLPRLIMTNHLLPSQRVLNTNVQPALTEEVGVGGELCIVASRARDVTNCQSTRPLQQQKLSC